MPKAIIRVIDLKPKQIKAIVFTRFREGQEPLEREMVFRIERRCIYDELFENLNNFLKVRISSGEVFNIYDSDEDLDRLRKVTNFVL